MSVRVVLAALVVLVLAVGVGVAAERAVTTCGERFPATSGELRSAEPPERILRGSEFLVDIRRRELADARAVPAGLGLGEPVWAAGASFPGRVGSVGERLVFAGGGDVAAFAANDGRVLWERELPGYGARLRTYDQGAAVLSASGDPGDEDSVHAAMLDADGQLLRCETFDAPESGPRFDLEPAAGGLVAFVQGGEERTQVRLFDEGGAEERWSTELEGDWSEGFVSGDTVVVAGRANAPDDADAVAGLSLEDGEQRWGVPVRALRQDVSGPPAGGTYPELDDTPRLTRLQAAGKLVVGHAVVQVTDAGDLAGGRLMALDPGSGRVVWRTQDRLTLLREGDEYASDPELVLAAPGDNPQSILAYEAQSGRRVWRTRDAGAGKDLGDLLPAGPRIYAAGGRPIVLAAANGRVRELGSETARWFAVGGALTANRLAILLDDGLLIVFARE